MTGTPPIERLTGVELMRLGVDVATPRGVIIIGVSSATPSQLRALLASAFNATVVTFEPFPKPAPSPLEITTFLQEAKALEPYQEAPPKPDFEPWRLRGKKRKW